MTRVIRFLGLGLLLLVSAASGLRADSADRPPIRPRICLGFNPEDHLWGWDIPMPIRERVCPRHYAFLGIDRASGRLREGAEVPALGDCCPLPSDDILTDDHIFTPDICPDLYLATGARFTNFASDTAPSELRCTKINTRRYQLSAEERGVMWGAASQAAFFFYEPEILRRSEIPWALRAGTGRRSRVSWHPAGCVSEPAGAILTGKAGKLCGQMHFRRLLFAGGEGDPTAGTPVPMFPACSALSDIFSPSAECLP